MATAAQIAKVRLYIDDKNADDFSDTEITNFIDEKNSVNYAVKELLLILITRLRNQLMESDTTGAEKTDLAPLRDRLKMLQSLLEEFKAKYEEEINTSTGLYISTVKPTIAGGDI